MNDEQPKREYVSNQTLQLELKAMRSEFRLWLMGAIVANGVLSHVVLPTTVGVVGSFAALGIIAAKIILLR